MKDQSSSLDFSWVHFDSGLILDPEEVISQNFDKTGGFCIPGHISSVPGGPRPSSR